MKKILVIANLITFTWHVSGLQAQNAPVSVMSNPSRTILQPSNPVSSSSSVADFSGVPVSIPGTLPTENSPPQASKEAEGKKKKFDFTLKELAMLFLGPLVTVFMFKLGDFVPAWAGKMKNPSLDKRLEKADKKYGPHGVNIAMKKYIEDNNVNKLHEDFHTLAPKKLMVTKDMDAYKGHIAAFRRAGEKYPHLRPQLNKFSRVHISN